METEVFKVPTLILAGSRVANARYLIVAEQIDRSVAGSLVEVQMDSGSRFRLVGEEAELFWRRLLALVPATTAEVEAASGAVSRTQVRTQEPGTGSAPPLVEPGSIMGG